MDKKYDLNEFHNTNTETTLLDNKIENNNSLNLSLDDSSKQFKIDKEEEKTLLTLFESSSISNSKLKTTEIENILPTDNISIKLEKKHVHFLSDIKCFTFFMSLTVMLTNALTVGYRNSVITTIEKRFEFSSVFSGVLSGCLEIGSLITTLFVSYFCANSHIPKCIAIGSIFCSIGSILYSLPHFLSGSYTINNKVMNKTANDFLCKPTSVLANELYLFNISTNTPEVIKKSPVASIKFLNPFDLKSECLLKPSYLGHFVILILANVLIGSSSAPLYTLGTTYIDNHVDKDNSSIYLAFIYSMLAFGPLIGYLIGAGALQVYVDGLSYSIKDLNINTNDSNWIGAWFAGFLLLGILIFLTSFPFFLFPKEIRKKLEKDKHGEDSIEENNYGELKNFPKAIKNIITNKTFMIVSVAFCFEITIISGFMTFLPKYLEHQFSVNNSMANIYTGGIAIPGACIGIVAGGFLVKKFRIDPKGASLMAIFCNIICLFGIISLIFIGCSNIKMAGTTVSYNSYGSVFNMQKLDIKLDNECNQDCQCLSNSIEPICGKNGLTYFSPCFAGCKYNDKITNTFSNCKCIQSEQNSTHIPDAINGSCSFSCDKLVPFLIILFLITLLTSLNQMPMLMVTLRSVDEIERPFALGLQLVIMRLLAYIPSPLIFGQAIDWTCLIWRKDECDKTGSCLFYDREKFRHVFGSIASVYKGISLLLFIFLYLSVRKFNYKQKPIGISAIIRASVTSLNNNNHHHHNQHHHLN